MQATLIYNSHSGGSHRIDPEEIVILARGLGYEAHHRETQREKDLDQVLEDLDGVVLVAGGDGTIRAVTTRLVGKNLPLVILPIGTANNIAHNLGISGSLKKNVAALAEPEIRNFDVGLVQSPWGKGYFLESFGYGLFAEMLKRYGVKNDKSILRSIESVKETLKNYQPRDLKIRLDGKDIGGLYMLLEAHNTPTLGPRIPLAPEAKTDDALLDVVRLPAAGRLEWLNYLGGLIRGDLEDVSGVEIDRGKQLEIAWTGFPVHLDETIWPNGIEGRDVFEKQVEDSWITVGIIAGALEIWIPRSGDIGSD